MKSTNTKLEFDWDTLSLENCLDLMKKRKVAVKSLVVDGNRKKLILNVRYMPSVKRYKIEYLPDDVEAVIDLETKKTLYFYNNGERFGFIGDHLDLGNYWKMIEDENNS